MWIVNATKAQAEQTYKGKRFEYVLSADHVLAVTVEAVKVYGGVVLCALKVDKILKCWNPDKTDYRVFEKENEYVLAGRLSPL